MNGGAIFWTEQFVDHVGVPLAGVRVWHYAAGTTTPKDVWVDEGKTAPATNPVTGDSSGRVSFYADGDYRLRIETAAGILLYDYDHVHLTADRAIMWEGDRGTSYPAATALNRGQLFGLLDAFDHLVELGVNDDGTGFHPVPLTLSSSTKAALPPAGTPGRLRRVTDSVRGIWMDTGIQWISLSGQVVNVQEFGAQTGTTTDQSAAFQAAADALAAIGGGILLIPPGTYVVDHFTIANNSWVRGSGATATVLQSSASSGTQGIIANTDATNGNSYLRVSDLTLQRLNDVVTPGVYNELLYFTKSKHVTIERCRGLGVATAHSSAARGFSLDGCQDVSVIGCALSGIAEIAIAVLQAADPTQSGRTIVRDCIIEQAGNWEASGVVVSANHVQVVSCQLHATFKDPAPLPYLVEVRDAPSDVLVTACHAINAGLAIIHAGARVRILDNFSQYGGIQCVADQGAIYNPIIAGNSFYAGFIHCRGTDGGTLERAVVQGNVIDGAEAAQASPGTQAIVVATATSTLVQANTVHHVQGGGFGIFGGNIQVLDNVAHDVGLAGATDNGLQEGFYLTAVAANMGPGLCARNLAHDCPRYGFQLDAPQHLSFVDNEYHDNTTADLNLVNMTATGSTPFGRIRLHATATILLPIVNNNWGETGSVLVTDTIVAGHGNMLLKNTIYGVLAFE